MILLDKIIRHSKKEGKVSLMLQIRMLQYDRA